MHWKTVLQSHIYEVVYEKDSHLSACPANLYACTECLRFRNTDRNNRYG